MEQLNKTTFWMFTGVASSNDSAIMKQIQATHRPTGKNVDVKSLISVIKGIMHGTTLDVDADHDGTNEDEATLDQFTILANFDENLASIVQQIACKMTCKCSGEDLHATTMSIFGALSNYSWDAKLVISLSALVMIYGEFWLVTRLSTTNLLAKYVGFFKQIPSILEHYDSLKPQFEAMNDLIKTILDAINCIVEFNELPTKYISLEKPPMSNALGFILVAAYWALQSINICALQIVTLVNIKYGDDLPQIWDFSSLAHKVTTIQVNLKKQIDISWKLIDEEKEKEKLKYIFSLFETIHKDNMKILRAFFYTKDDIQPLINGSTKTPVYIEVLRKKHLLLLISNLDISHEEIASLDRLYKDSKTKEESKYEIVWLPIIDKSTSKDKDCEHKLKQLQEMMSWYIVRFPELIDHAVIKYIKEKWHFLEKPILVSLDSEGKIMCENAFKMLWTWGNSAFPFSTETESNLWKTATWSLELLISIVDVTLVELLKEGKLICLYGGKDMEWIRKFVRATTSIAETTNFSFELVYVGKSKNKERVREINKTIKEENLSRCFDDVTMVWLFWERLESMMHSILQFGKTTENDKMLQEIMGILSYDDSDQGWAILCQGTEVAKAKGSRALNAMLSFDKWKLDAYEKGFILALNNYLNQIVSPSHCNHLILPRVSGEIPRNTTRNSTFYNIRKMLSKAFHNVFQTLLNTVRCFSHNIKKIC